MNPPRSILRVELAPMKQYTKAFPICSCLGNDLLDWDLLELKPELTLLPGKSARGWK